eukprot:scaffold109165_cov49-Phaeocystis_antarctica.AAC.1
MRPLLSPTPAGLVGGIHDAGHRRSRGRPEGDRGRRLKAAQQELHVPPLRLDRRASRGRREPRRPTWTEESRLVAQRLPHAHPA